MNPRQNRFLNMQEEVHPNCPGCGKPAYPSERPLMCLGTKWHPGCIKCTVCKITLSPRSMETYEKKPYCQAHRPTATATQIADDFHKQQAVTAPKAPRRAPGVDVTARQTFYAGSGSQQLDQLQQMLHKDKASINPSGFVPSGPAVPNRTRTQGINKMEGTTFNEASITNQRGTAPIDEGNQAWGGEFSNEPAPSHSYSAPAPAARAPPAAAPRMPPPSFSAPVPPAPVEETYDQSYDQGSYDQGADQGSYDQGGDQGGYDQGSYDQGGDQGGYDQSYDQGSYDQGGDQGGYDQGSYDQGGDQGYDQSYDQGGDYQEGSYDQGYDQSYDQGGYDQSYDQGDYQ